MQGAIGAVADLFLVSFQVFDQVQPAAPTPLEHLTRPRPVAVYASDAEFIPRLRILPLAARATVHPSLVESRHDCCEKRCERHGTKLSKDGQ